MNEQSSHIIELLKAKGLRVTPQRFAVYANLCGRGDHPTAEQLLTDINQDVPIASQATIYTALQALQNVGLVREVLLEEGVARYDANVHPHHHFRCRCCGEIEDIAWEVFQGVNLSALRPGLKAEQYEVAVQGVCDRCEPASINAFA
ncbi:MULTISPECIES: Fur family transcriptional regulator [unclassified Leptolyngbya]|uniref:Fur family transcriptional regulator n=1 Tax=unclassified Leptolyngbya TaxID=2650499 RepID=UPI0016894DFE|nr:MULTISPECIES: Fur family transcriptional regulator [unclassified Leptolyngbya]MBD1911901.1 transcriptional repressor [Leptolyngbya sp. FACHB-8]MBD2156110.1 transcriptional repressor [Leptolyngbya sp. FACHB-16]